MYYDIINYNTKCYSFGISMQLICFYKIILNVISGANEEKT